jgi:hypothetical protein
LNEPNLDRHLYPQRNRNGVPLSPMIYRALYQAGRRGLAASGHANDTILFGELFPTTRSRFKVPPVEFMREVACLSSSYRPFRGNARKARKCPVSPAKLFASGIALHPYLPGTFVGGGGSLRGLRTPPRGRADVTIGYMHRMSRVIDKLNSKGRINGRLPLFVTEYGFQTKPPDIYATPIRTAARFMDESEWLAYRSARVKSYSHYQLVDQPLRNRRGPARYSLFQMGLRFPNGNKKPHVYPAFEMPFFVRLKRGGNLEIFGGVRAWPFSTVEVFQRSKARGARYHSLGTATLNSRGYFRIFRRISNSSGRYYRLKFTTPTGRVMRRTKTGVKR